MAISLLPATALVGPVCKLPGEQAEWTDGCGVWFWRDCQSWLPLIQEEVALCSLKAVDTKPLGHSVLLRSDLFCFFFFFLPPQILRETGELFPTHFQEARVRPLFFQSKAETVRIRAGSMKSTLKGSVCHQDGGWSSPQPSHILALSLDQRGAFTLPSSRSSRIAQGRPWGYQVPISQRSTSLLPVGASLGLSHPHLLLQEASLDCCHPQDFTTWLPHGLGSRQQTPLPVYAW